MGCKSVCKFIWEELKDKHNSEGKTKKETISLITLFKSKLQKGENEIIN